MIKRAFTSLILLVLISCKSAKTDFKFDKITYHTSACFGFCPVVHLEVNADKSIRLHAEKIYSKIGGGTDISRIGYFTGIVADSTFNKLINELRTIGLDTLKFDGPDCCDGATKTIIAHYNGKRKYFRAMFPPDRAFPLIAILNDIYSASKLTRTPEEFELERDSIH